MKGSNYEKEFKIPTSITTRTQKTSMTPLRENSSMKLGENALSWENEVFNNTLEPLAEVEWSSATALLSEENLESELNLLNAQYNDLVLNNEQLRRENEDVKLKLKEKSELEEFEFLAQKQEKEQETLLMHEVSNLKNLIKRAEEYNQDLENELSSKVELLKEKEDQIKNLQEYLDAQKSEKMKIDLSYSLEATEDLKQVMLSLSDMDTVALDAMRESAFLRSENQELKEKNNELSDSCKQIENDIQMCQCQLEAKRKIRTDLDKELQSAFQEISKLNALVDGKGLLSNLELEKRITDLQKELNKEVEEKETWQKEVTLLLELKSLLSEVEVLRKELHEKSEELCIITEREKLFSEIAHKDSRIQCLLEEIGNTKDDLAASQLSQRNSDEESQALKSLHMELEHRHEGFLEERERMKQEIGTLSKEAESLALSLDSMKAEHSHKTQELEQKTIECQERLNKMEELREELESRDSSLQSVEEKALLTEKLL